MINFLIPLLWTLCVTILASSFFIFSYGSNWLAVGIASALTVFVGYWLVFQKAWGMTNASGTHTKIGQHMLAFTFSLLAPAVTLFCILVVSIYTLVYSYNHFEASRKSLLSNPLEFPYLRNFAKENFDMDVVLATTKESWAPTTFNNPEASPASMSLRPGYCVMNFNRANLLTQFGPSRTQDDVSWIQGIMMHEFAHCLDLARDLPSFGAPHTYKVASIAPIDSGTVNNVVTYLDATEKNTTGLWREAFADIFAIGFWRLVEPLNVDTMAKDLRLHRTSNVGDQIHATACWIDQALKQDAPASVKDLVAWSDHIRASSTCSLSIPIQDSTATAALKFLHLK